MELNELVSKVMIPGTYCNLNDNIYKIIATEKTITLIYRGEDKVYNYELISSDLEKGMVVIRASKNQTIMDIELDFKERTFRVIDGEFNHLGEYLYYAGMKHLFILNTNESGYDFIITGEEGETLFITEYKFDETGRYLSLKTNTASSVIKLKSLFDIL